MVEQVHAALRHYWGGPGMSRSRLLELLIARGTLSVGEAAQTLEANRHTLKDKFSELIQKGHAELRGKGRGAHYRPMKP